MILTCINQDSLFLWGLCMPGKKMIYEMENCLLQIFVHILGHHQARMILHHQILHKSKARWRIPSGWVLSGPQTQASRSFQTKPKGDMSLFLIKLEQKVVFHLETQLKQSTNFFISKRMDPMKLFYFKSKVGKQNSKFKIQKTKIQNSE